MRSTLKITLVCMSLTLFAACSSDSMDAANENYSPMPPSQTKQGEPWPGDPVSSGDKYEAPGTNPYVMTAHDPLSTFAADVDTASYDIFRRDVELGSLPNKDSVRLEEYVNYFPYAHPAPAASSAVPFAITMAAAESPFQSGTTLISVGIKGKEVPWEKRPANLVFLIDVSGSMTSATKLPLVKKVLLETLEVLDPSDTISIVSYAGSTSVRLQPTLITDRATIEAAITGLSSGGSTSGAAGITLAYEQAEVGFKEGGINHVLLCTDGDFNVGISSNADLVSLIEEKRKTGITLTVLGFGYGNLNDSMMEAITNAGNGVYGVISSEDQAVKYVNERLLSTMNHIAKDVKIQVEFSPSKVLAYRLLGYENRALEDDQFTDDKVDAGEIGSGHTVTALYEVVLLGNEIPAPEGAPSILDGAASDHVSEMPADELCRVRLRYKAPDAAEEDLAEQIEQRIAAGEVVANLADAASDFQWAAGIAAFAEIIKQSPFAKAQALDALAQIFAANVGTDGDRLEFVELFGQARGMMSNP